MKISSLQENLKQGLQIVSHTSIKSVNLPILSNILIEAVDGNIRLVSTNLEIGVISNVRGKIEAEGRYTVDTKIINDYIALLPNKKVELELKDDILKIECDNYKTKLRGQSAEEYPLIPVVDRNEYYILKKEDFKKALSQTVFATAPSETRLELSGVLFIFSQNSLTLAATDSYRLAERTVAVKVSGEKNDSEEIKKVIVPAKTVQEVVRIFADGSEDSGQELKIYLSDNQILFADNNTELVSRLIEGQFPDYQQIIPKNHKTTAIINRQELTRAVKASSLFSKTGINDVNLDLPQDKNEVVVSSASGQTGESVISITAGVKGVDNGVVVNHRYLLDGLNNIDSENVKLEITDNNTPCILRPEKDSNYLYIIMPIKQ